MTRRKFLGLAAAAAAVTGAGGVALARGVRRAVTVKHHRVALPGAGGLRVVHLTDLHVGWATPQEILDEAKRLCERVEPDLVVLTGDYVNHSLKHLDRVRRFVRALPRPCVATLGNHDHWSGAEAIGRALQTEGVVVLRNEPLRLRLGQRRLTLVGVDDGFSGHDDAEAAFAGVDEPGRALVLTHFPGSADSLIARGARLVLAGHTHGGQVDVPFLTPTLARTVGSRYLSGWYDLGEGGRLYVNAGLGSSAARWRIGEGAAPEVAVLDLDDEPRRGASVSD